ncbi:hypothetical protein PF002_g12318 [Phytophthora fragariae]|uniref:RNase H type-1 domain-containing protein n=2 Tax=Phytophthora fragariae TaxID=53985 RepID=A0A6A3ZCV9_9STRA|nr:hypothetical protein PF002_g12318 [Phytophthora fragariae]
MPAPGAAPAATAAAIAEAAVAADAAAQAADQVAAQDPVQTTYAHSATEFGCSVCAYVAGNMATLVAHRRSAHRGTRFSDIFDSGCACSLVFHSRVAATSHALACAQRASQAAPSSGTPMDVDQGHTPPDQRRSSPRRSSERRSDGKRRRLNSADDADAQKLAEHLQLVDEDGVEDPAQAHKPSAASPLSAPVLAVYVHNAQRFTCTLCTYTAASFGTLQRHRDTRHRRVAFQDRFLAGCACGTPFASRPAAARHAKACAGPRTPTTEAPRPASSTDVDIHGQEAEAEARGRWGPPLPREVVASRIADRLGEIEPPRVVASRIADRLASPSPDVSLLDEETKESEPTHYAVDEESTTAEPMDVVVETTMDSDPPTTTPRAWRLQFDGACRSAHNPGGAGALLYNPEGAVVWTGSHYIPGAQKTNNTAEYTALLIGACAAADHGATSLRVEGDSLLVIRQVKGLYATKSTRLRKLRNAVRHELARVGQHSLHHIDRQGNAFADRLANRALDTKSDKIECKEHPVAGACTTLMGPPSTDPPATPPPAPVDAEMMDADSDSEPRADIDDGEIYAPMRLEPGVIPARRPRLRLRQLTDDEMEAAGEVVERLSAALSAKITNASDWETAEGYITALPYLLYDELQPYTQSRQARRSTPHEQPPPGTHDQHSGTTAGSDGNDECEQDPAGEPRPAPPRRRRRGRKRRRKGHRQRRHPRQKGFRSVNGCGEHNFLAATLIDHARRRHKPLYEVCCTRLQIAHGWQMLHSPDPGIRCIAREQLYQIADERHRLDRPHWQQRRDELCGRFLNFELGMSVHAPAKRRTGDIDSLWTDIRKNLKKHGLKLETAPADPASSTPARPLQPRVPHHAEWLDHRNVLRHVKQHMKITHWQGWCALPDQGKTARAHGGVGSAFLTRPRGLWESDYRFAVAARLNQVDTQSVLQRRHLRTHGRCRQPGCSHEETLPHVLHHCPGTMDAIRGRHDDALKNIERALIASSGDRQDRAELRVNQTVPSLAGPALRPDLQLYNHTKKTVAVVDLAVAFEEQASDDPESSGLARIAAHKRHLERQGWKVHLSELVYGSLGAVASGNHKVYTEHLGLLKRDAKRLDRQLSVACIQSSRRIWNLHCAQHRARQQSRGDRATETGGTPSRSGRH